MIRSIKLLPLVAAFLLAVAVPASGQIYDTFVIPVVGSTSGAGGTQWASELTIFNPHPHTLYVSVTFLPSGLAQGSEALVTVPSNQVFATSNVVSDLFRRSGTGALLVATWPDDNKHVPAPSILDLSFIVRSNTFNNSSSGTYGQAIPGVIAGLMDFEYDGLSAIASGVRNFGQPGSSGFRTNIGAVNLGRATVHMLVRVFNHLGEKVGNDLPFDVPPQGHIQDPLPVAIDRGTLEFFVIDPGVADPETRAVVFAYASVVDNRSGDPIYVDPLLLQTPRPLYPYALSPDPLSVGKKLDKEIARRVRDSVERVGTASMVTREDGTREVVVTR